MRRTLLVLIVALWAFAPVSARVPFAVAYVNGNIATGSATDTAQVVLNGVTSGNALVVSIGHGGATTTVTSLVDDASNTYTSRCGRTFLTNAGGVTMFTATNVTGGNLTLTLTLSATAADIIFAVEEYSGVSGYDAASAGSTGTSTTPLTTITTVAANAMIVGGFQYQGTGSTFTNGSGYTTRHTAAPGIRHAVEDQLVTSATSYNVDGTITSAAWTACAVSLSPSASASFIPGIINAPIRGGGR